MPHATRQSGGQADPTIIDRAKEHPIVHGYHDWPWKLNVVVCTLQKCYEDLKWCPSQERYLEGVPIMSALWAIDYEMCIIRARCHKI